MTDLGKMNRLAVVKQVDFGFYLDGDDLDEILLPIRYRPEGLGVGDDIDVFVYLDSEDRPVATTETPLAQVGEVAHLRAVGKSDFGTFLDWGLPKDLLVPFKEQRIPMEEGRSYTVFLFIDVTGRIAASSKLSRHMPEVVEDERFAPHQEVALHIASRSDAGYKAVVDGTHLGLIHASEVLTPLRIGDDMTGFIGGIRDDGRLDLVLEIQTAEGRATRRSDLEQRILDYVIARGGTTTVTDKSDPQDIYEAFGVSKGKYKKALGKLYKERRVQLVQGKVILLK